MSKQLALSDNDKKIAGVCGGIAKYLGIDSTIVRIFSLFAMFVSVGTGLLFYFIAWILMAADAKED